ncbi:voltage-gated potassium channel [Natronoarchaeum philippinense]|uniref:Voltage-gated potassium channel n=1 Tax=Natronoarchaeum philippinense TaxID=558529 RepID=A0A285PBR7_NATPI|nr:NAD-binding protein [Natronoarchaeum philippinense]SNZ17301.1 voltage-gated potassium channel [Natronoarchaeum philippinense]
MVRGRRLVSGRAAVTLTTVVAVLSVITGIANIGVTTVGPLDPYVPGYAQQLAGFTGTLTGFLMLGAVLGLRRGQRAAWYAVLVLLPVTAAQGIIQSSSVSYPLVALSVLSIPVVAANRRHFSNRVGLTTTQMAAAIALTGVQAYGTVGSYILREEFNGVNTMLDAFYFTIVTATTVGYGDVSPTSQEARLFGMSVVVFGAASFAVALGSLLGPAIEARLSHALGKMTDSQLELLEDHVLVLGYGELTEPILTELHDAGSEFVVVTGDQEHAAALSDRDYNVFTGDPSDEEPLHRVRIEDARAIVVATNDDAEDALTILTARELRPDVRIVAAATDRENVRKLRRAGADDVISPASIGGRLLVRSAFEETEEPSAEDVLDEFVGE